jgi:hypothetical protein
MRILLNLFVLTIDEAVEGRGGGGVRGVSSSDRAAKDGTVISETDRGVGEKLVGVFEIKMTKGRHRERDRERQRESERERQRESERETERDRERERKWVRI